MLLLIVYVRHKVLDARLTFGPSKYKVNHDDRNDVISEV